MSFAGGALLRAVGAGEHLLEHEDASCPLIGRAGGDGDRRRDAERLRVCCGRTGGVALAEDLVEVGVDAVRIDRAILGILPEHFHDELVERLRHARVQRAKRGRRLVHVLDEERGDVGRGEGELPGEHLEEHDAERVEIARAAGVVAEDALGSHVLRRSEELAPAR